VDLAAQVKTWCRAHPLAVDAALAVAVVAVALPGLWWGPNVDGVVPREPDFLAVVLVLASSLPLVWRRRAPVAVFTCTAPPSVALSALDYTSSAGGLSVLIMVYTVATRCRRRTALASLAASQVAFAVVIVTDAYPDDGFSVLVTACVFVGSHIVGRNVAIRRAYTAGLEERALRLEQAREADTRAALAEERGRIARELHDVVAHHVSVMTVQAAAASRTVERDPLQAREAMAAVEAIGRAALTEMRSIVGVLRDDSGPTGPGELLPQPGLADLDALIEQLAEAGQVVELERRGRVRPLPAGLDLAAFRVLQEALTNVFKHAGPTPAQVCLEYGQRELVVRVLDSGRGAAAGTPSEPDDGAMGHGLLGMRERVGLYHGQFSAGPRAGGGWQMEARLPLEGPMAAAAASTSAPTPPSPLPASPAAPPLSMPGRTMPA